MFERKIHIDRQADGKYMLFDGRTYEVCGVSKVGKAVGEAIEPICTALLNGQRSFTITISTNNE